MTLGERNHQIKFMGEIYRRASTVLAHLPYHNPKDHQPGEWSSISLIALLNRVWEKDEDYSMKPEEEWERILSTNYNNLDMCATSLTFWMNTWFTRCWILQEEVLNDVVLVFFGAATCSLNAVTTFWDLARRRDVPRVLKHGPLADVYITSQNLSQIGSLKRIQEWLQKPSEKGKTRESVQTRVRAYTQQIRDSHLSLLNLLIMSRTNGATDPRDKVYALLSLANDKAVEGINPDYSDENTVAKVYLDVTRRYLQLGSGPELLHYAGNDHLVADLPSWAVDWSHQTRSSFNKRLYDCSGPAIPCMRTSEPGKLEVRGAIVDPIAYVGFACRYYSMDVSLDRLHPMLEDQASSLPLVDTDHHMRQVVYATGKMFCENFCCTGRYTEPPDLVLGRTLAADCTRSGLRSDTAFFESWAAYQRYNDDSLQMQEMSRKIEPGSEEE